MTVTSASGTPNPRVSRQALGGSGPAPRNQVRAPALTLSNYVPGTKVRIQGTQPPVVGMLLGHNSNDEAIVSPDARPGKRSEKWTGSFSSLVAVSAAPGRPLTSTDRNGLLLDGISPDSIHPVPARVLRAVMAAMEQPVVGDRSARDYAESLMRQGHQVMLVGGGIRDVLAELEANPGSSNATLVDLLKDIDLSTTASPKEIVSICGREGRFTRAKAAGFGLVGFGHRKEGLDISALHFGYARDEGGVLGRRLMDDVRARDFTANQVYLKSELDRDGRINEDRAFLIDPTGRGIDDAKANRLRVANPEWGMLNASLPFRYLKFRNRGMLTDPETCAFMRQSTQRHLTNVDEDKFVDRFMRIKPASMYEDRELKAHLLELMEVAKEDGIGDLIYKHVYRRRRPLYTRLAEFRYYRDLAASK